ETQIDLTWDANPEPDIDHYNIYRDGILLDTSISNTYSDTGLEIRTTYTYTVAAVDTASQEGSLSEPASATTENFVPSQVTGLSAIANGETQIDLTWDANLESDIDHYNIYRDGSLIDTTTTNSYNDNGLTPNTTYTYTVAAVDTASQEGPQSDAASATTTEEILPPSKVKKLNIERLSSKNGITLSWDGNNESESISHYCIYRDGVLIATTTNTTYQDIFDPLEDIMLHTYQVSAVNAKGEGEMSEKISLLSIQKDLPFTPYIVEIFVVFGAVFGIGAMISFGGAAVSSRIIKRNIPKKPKLKKRKPKK
ncbi:MAG: hypothetical protein GF311_10815, partial [Candidatus Lokiarchaeota archaeon]|nr:hypothetical protein [Candidatus Lokiarchaeota archaeon]